MKKTKIVVYFLAASYFLFNVNLSLAGPTAGQVELSGQFYFSKPKGGDESGTINGRIGYFYSDHIQLGLSSFISVAKGRKFGSIGPGFDYYFNPGDDTVYYVGSSYQLDVSDSGAEDAVEGHIGLSKFFGEKVSVNGSLGYRDGGNSSETYALVGVSYYF